MYFSVDMSDSNDLSVTVGGTVGTIVLLIIGIVIAVFFLRYTFAWLKTYIDFIYFKMISKFHHFNRVFISVTKSYFKGIRHHLKWNMCNLLHCAILVSEERPKRWKNESQLYWKIDLVLHWNMGNLTKKVGFHWI